MLKLNIRLKHIIFSNLPKESTWISISAPYHFAKPNRKIYRVAPYHGLHCYTICLLLINSLPPPPIHPESLGTELALLKIRMWCTNKSLIDRRETHTSHKIYAHIPYLGVTPTDCVPAQTLVGVTSECSCFNPNIYVKFCIYATELTEFIVLF